MVFILFHFGSLVDVYHILDGETVESEDLSELLQRCNIAQARDIHPGHHVIDRNSGDFLWIGHLHFMEIGSRRWITWIWERVHLARPRGSWRGTWCSPGLILGGRRVRFLCFLDMLSHSAQRSVLVFRDCQLANCRIVAAVPVQGVPGCPLRSGCPRSGCPRFPVPVQGVPVSPFRVQGVPGCPRSGCPRSGCRGRVPIPWHEQQMHSRGRPTAGGG